MYSWLWIVIWDSNTILTKSTFTCKIWKSDCSSSRVTNLIHAHLLLICLPYPHLYLLRYLFPLIHLLPPCFSLPPKSPPLPPPNLRLCPFLPSMIVFSSAPRPPSLVPLISYTLHLVILQQLSPVPLLLYPLPQTHLPSYIVFPPAGIPGLE